MRFEIILKNPQLVNSVKVGLVHSTEFLLSLPFDRDVAQIYPPSLLSQNLKSKIRKS